MKTILKHQVNANDYIGVLTLSEWFGTKAAEEIQEKNNCAFIRQINNLVIGKWTDYGLESESSIEAKKTIAIVHSIADATVLYNGLVRISTNKYPAAAEDELIGNYVETNTGLVVRIMAKVDVGIATQPPRGYITETRYIGVDANTNKLHELQPYQMVKVITNKQA